jgi:glycosyltransferase involved in cell wall biosynthesis
LVIAGEAADLMRIGIDARLVYYTRAGIGEYTMRLTQALAAAFPAEHFVMVQDFRSRQPLVAAPNVAVSHCLVPSHHRLEQAFLPWALDSLQVDVYHSPDFIPPLRGAASQVITIHDLAFLIYPHFLTKESARHYGKIDRAVRRASHIIAVSESTKRDLIRLLGAPEDKITVIYEAADPMFHPVDRAAAMRQVQAIYDVPSDFILFVSTIEPRKNVAGLLRAYRRLRQDYRLTPALVLAGAPGWLSEDVYHLVDELQLRPYCSFLGHVSNCDLLQLYNAALCLVHPAFYEGFGLTPLEAMACGTPAVVSNVSSLPEVVGDAAILVDPSSDEEITVALMRILTEDGLREELHDKGLRRARAFSWQGAAAQTMAVYRQVAQT